MAGRFVGRRNASELADLTSARAFIQALGVARLAGLQVSIYIDFVETVTCRSACARPIGAVGRDKGGNNDDAGIGQQGRHFADPANIFRPVFGRESQVGIEATANIVAVEHVDLIALVEQALFQRHRQGRFARPGQPGEPQNAGPVAITLDALQRRYPVGLGGDVGCAHRDQFSLVRVMAHRDNAATHGFVFVGEHDTSGTWQGLMGVDSDKLRGVDNDVGDLVAHDPVGRPVG